MIPGYDDKSTRPWLHLLNPRWRINWIVVWGPFVGRRTIRSIHFTLPRSVPPSFSQGIRQLWLYEVNFCHFNDTACLVSELPDLVNLDLERVTCESLPTQLPRRRPRADRNKLQRIDVVDCKVKGAESPSFLFPVFTLFSNVYSVSSFFSPDLLTTAEAVLLLASNKSKNLNITHMPEGEIHGRVDHICEFFVVYITCRTIPQLSKVTRR